MKKAKTWIVTYIYLQLLFICFGSPCITINTDDMNNIDKLVGNLPNDYIMRMKPISKNSLPKHCWLFVMVYDVSNRLAVLSEKFSRSSENYNIVYNLATIFREIRNCVQFTGEKEDFAVDYSASVQEIELFPVKFFEIVSETMSAFSEINKTEFNTPCILPTVDPREVDSVTKGTVQFASSKLRNGRIGNQESSEVSSSSLLLPWTSIASIAISCVVVGFLLGVLCWKIKHHKGQENNEVAELHRDKKEDNELNNMLQLQVAKDISII